MGQIQLFLPMCFSLLHSLYGYDYINFNLMTDTVKLILWVVLYKITNADDLGILHKIINSNNLGKK